MTHTQRSETKFTVFFNFGKAINSETDVISSITSSSKIVLSSRISDKPAVIIEFLRLNKNAEKSMLPISYIINKTLRNQPTYSVVDLIHGQHMYTSFVLEHCQPLTQWRIFKTFQYGLLFFRHTDLAVQCFCYGCQTFVNNQYTTCITKFFFTALGMVISIKKIIVQSSSSSSYSFNSTWQNARMLTLIMEIRKLWKLKKSLKPVIG